MRKLVSLLLSLVGLAFAAQVHATTWFLDNSNSGGKTEGLTYVLEGTAVDSDTWSFILKIYGANVVGVDTRGGRTFLEDIAFIEPTGFLSTNPTSIAGGLNSSGCNGTGNFFCFNGVHLTASSYMTFAFDVNATGIASWAPDIKVQWLGSENNYNLVSLGFERGTCTNGDCEGENVPEPGSLALLGAGVMGLALIRRRRRV